MNADLQKGSYCFPSCFHPYYSFTLLFPAYLIQMNGMLVLWKPDGNHSFESGVLKLGLGDISNISKKITIILTTMKNFEISYIII